MITNIAHCGKPELDDIDFRNAGCVRTTDEGIDIHPERRAVRIDVRTILKRLALKRLALQQRNSA